MTRELAKQLADNSEVFYYTTTEVDGYIVEQYDYRFASYEDFKTNNAFELRGLTFIYDKDTNTWFKHLAMNKFFNVNENDDWKYKVLKEKTIVNVQDKLDGSFITFVKFPNGKIYAKSKMSFISEQAKLAQKIYEENEKLFYFVNKMIDNHFLMFELTSYLNQIVLNYSDTKLSLLQVRTKEGEYLNKTQLMNIKDNYNIDISSLEDIHSLEWYLNERETIKGIEGWILTFDDGTMAKVKTVEYLEKHGVFTNLREDMILMHVLKDDIDDIIAELNGEKKEYVIEITNIIRHKLNELIEEYKKLRFAYFNIYKENRKKFAIDKKNETMFSAVMKTLNTSFKDVNQLAKTEAIKTTERICNNLTNTKKWLEV